MLSLSRIIVSLFLSLMLVLCQFSSPALAQTDLSRIDFEVKVPDNTLENLLLQSGIHPGDSSKEVVIKNAVITLRNPRLGKTSSDGELRAGTGDTIRFRARQPLRFAPDTADTSVTFGTLMDRGNDTAEFIVFTGRWIKFFGIRICPGQQIFVPGEAQCV